MLNPTASFRLQEVVADLTPAAFVDGASQYYPEMTEDVRPDERGAMRVAGRLWRHQWSEYWGGDGDAIRLRERATTRIARTFADLISNDLQFQTETHCLRKLSGNDDGDHYVPELRAILDKYSQTFSGRFKPRLCWGMTPPEQRAALFAQGEYPVAFTGQATNVDGYFTQPIALPAHDISHLINLASYSLWWR